MRWRRRTLMAATAAVLVAVPSAGFEPSVFGPTRDKPAAPQLTAAAPMGAGAAVPQAPPAQPTAAFDGLDGRARQATTDAANDGADISALVLDRSTGQQVSNGNGRGLAIASVAKLFIADDLLLRESQGQAQLSPADRTALDTMLRSSDDNAAENFWSRGGGGAIITRVAGRYGLRSTSPPGNGRWWNTISSAADLVRYYDMLISGSGGLAPENAGIILNNLAQSTPQGIDGYPQRFGIPEGLFAETAAVKQGWMCCIGSDWMHLSTGVIGPDRRYIMVIGSMHPTSDSTARATITQAVKTMFPGGRIS